MHNARMILDCNAFPHTLVQAHQRFSTEVTDGQGTTNIHLIEFDNPYNDRIAPMIGETAQRRTYAPLPHFQRMRPNTQTIGTPVHTIRNLNNMHKNLNNTKHTKNYIND